MNRLNQILGTRFPVLSAPMGGVAGGALAAAVADAGGAGLVGVSYGDPEFIVSQLPLATESTGVWGAGIVMFTFDQNPGLLDMVLSYRPQLVVLSFGDDEQTTRYVNAIQSEGLLVAVQIHDVPQAQGAAAAGADVIIAQGAEAGGHHKTTSTFPLLPAVADTLQGRIPLVAAGGIADGRGLAAALALGADGVMVGTRFAAAAEALTSPSFVTALLSAHSTDLVNTRAFDVVRSIPWPQQYTARSIANSFAREWAGREDELARQAPELAHDWTVAVAADDPDQRPLFAGESVDLVTDIEPAGTILQSIIDGAIATLGTIDDQSITSRHPADVSAITH